MESPKWAPDGQRVISQTGDYQVQLINGASPDVISEPLMTVSKTTGFAIDPKDERCAVASADGTVNLFSTVVSRRASIRFPHAGGFSPALSHDGKLVATADPDGALRIWNATDGTARPVRIVPPSPPTTVRFSLDGELLAAGLGDGGVRIWTVETGEDTGFAASAAEPIADIDLSDDRRLIVAAEATGRLHGWDTGTSRPLWQHGEARHGSAISGVRFLPGTDQFVTTGLDGEIPIWDRSGKKVGEIASDPGALISQVQFGPRREVLYAILGGVKTTSWDVASRQTIHDHPITGGPVLVQTGGRLLNLAGLNMNAVSISDPEMGTGLVHLLIGQAVGDLIPGDDGAHVAATVSGMGSSLRIWEVLPSLPIADPPFLAELAELVNGSRILPGENRASAIPLDERLRRLDEMRRDADPNTPEGRLAAWLLDDPWDRKISPGATLGIREHILRDTSVPDERLMPSLLELFYNYPSHPLVWAAVAERLHEADPDIATFARKRAGTQDESVAKFCYELSAYLLRTARHREALHYAERALDEGFDEAKVRARIDEIGTRSD